MRYVPAMLPCRSFHIGIAPADRIERCEPPSILLLAANEPGFGIKEMSPAIGSFHEHLVVFRFAERLGYLRDTEVPVCGVDGFSRRLIYQACRNIAEL